MSRLEQLLRFAEEEPGDPFNFYAVAIEYLKLDSEKAVLFFERLITDHASYLPTYYTYGKLLQEKRDYPRAQDVFNKGVLLAVKQGDRKAEAELKNALLELEFEME